MPHAVGPSTGWGSPHVRAVCRWLREALSWEDSGWPCSPRCPPNRGGAGRYGFSSRPHTHHSRRAPAFSVCAEGRKAGLGPSPELPANRIVESPILWRVVGTVAATITDCRILRIHRPTDICLKERKQTCLLDMIKPSRYKDFAARQENEEIH